MQKIIENLRKQPEHKRRHILHLLTICFAFILVGLWLYSLGASITNTDNQAKVNQDLKPFSAIKNNLVGGYESLSSGNNTNQQ